MAYIKGTARDWRGDLDRIWCSLPDKVRFIAGEVLGNILVVDPEDSRLNGANAVIKGDTCIISQTAEPEEILHEVGHVLTQSLSPHELEHLDDYYDFSKEHRSPEDVLAEDFYFMMKGSKPAPFWKDWLTRSEGEEMNGIHKRATTLPMRLLDAFLDEIADLVIASGNQQLVTDWGISKDALRQLQLQTQLSYENVAGPRQYYYSEDLEGTSEKAFPMSQPLEVSRPDVTMRELVPGGGRMS